MIPLEKYNLKYRFNSLTLVVWRLIKISLYVYKLVKECIIHNTSPIKVVVYVNSSKHRYNYVPYWYNSTDNCNVDFNLAITLFMNIILKDNEWNKTYPPLSQYADEKIETKTTINTLIILFLKFPIFFSSTISPCETVTRPMMYEELRTNPSGNGIFPKSSGYVC